MKLISNVNFLILIFSFLLLNAKTHAQNSTTIQPFLEENIKVKEPISLLFDWQREALRKNDPDSYLAYLATVNKAGIPSVRPLALFDIDEEGFLFFTQHNSRKAKDIAENPNVAMALFWKTLQRVVRIEGVAEKLTEEESLPVFRTKSRATQIRLYASVTSQRVPDRQCLRDLEAKITEKFAPNETIPLPNWGGYIIIPNSVEFWQAQPDLINDRIRFRRGEGVEDEVDGKLVHLGEDGWVYERLGP